ncbi:MAG: hypothetical protein ABI901_04980 [Roseiflexaceae bacterium]
MMRRRDILTLLVALILGALIAWVDSRPTWDDTGITAGVLLLVCAGFGAIHPRLAWLWALALGAWIPLAGIVIAHNYSSLLALGIALIGAYLGLAAHYLLGETTTSGQR